MVWKTYAEPWIFKIRLIIIFRISKIIWNIRGTPNIYFQWHPVRRIFFLFHSKRSTELSTWLISLLFYFLLWMKTFAIHWTSSILIFFSFFLPLFLSFSLISSLCLFSSLSLSLPLSSIISLSLPVISSLMSSLLIYLPLLSFFFPSLSVSFLLSLRNCCAHSCSLFVLFTLY